MPDPSIEAAARKESVIRLYHRAAWGDAWVEEPRAKVITASRFLASRIGECDFLCYFGDWLLQPGSIMPALYLPLEFVGHFIKVTSQKDGQSENRDWTGIIVDDAVSYKSNVAMRGIQRVKAFTLEFLLYRTIIHKAKVYHNTATTEIDWAPSFNLRDSYDRGERQIDPTGREFIGNAHGELDKFGGDVRWNAWKAVQYLLDNYAPGLGDIPWAIKGQYESLGQWEDIWPQEQLSLGAIIDSLISNKSGYTWYVDVYDFEDDEFVDLRVQTMFGSDFVVGDKTIPANDRQIVYTIPTDIPDRHVFGSPEFHYSITEKYKNIIIQGNRIKVLGTWSPQDDTLTVGWTFLQEEEYRECTQVPLVTVHDPITDADVLAPDVHACDIYRARDIFRWVFSAFTVPYPFDGFLGDGKPLSNLSKGAKQFVIPTPDDAGEVTFEELEELPFYQLEKRFLPHIPLLEGFDYTKSELDEDFDQRLGGTDTDYRKLLLLFQEPYSGLYLRAERMSEDEQYLHPSTAESLRHTFGIEVKCSPAHHNAGASPSEDIPDGRRGVRFHEPINSEWDNQLDYRRLVLTAFFETDQRPRIVLEGSSDPGAITDLVVTVKSCEYWYALANTVVEVEPRSVVEPLDDVTDCNLLYINADWAVPNALRQDKDVLEIIAAITQEWFQVQRQKIRLPVNDVGYGTSITPELGMYLKGVNGILLREDVNSIVSGITFDYRRGASLIETDFLGLSERIHMGELIHQMERVDASMSGISKLSTFLSSQ